MKSKRLIFLIIWPLLVHCPLNTEDAMMWRLYKTWHKKIKVAVSGTDISASYMAAIISLESRPVGNPKSSRFEKKIYSRLIELRDNNKRFGYMLRSSIRYKSDKELKSYATSHGLTQVMGYHCIKLKCNQKELQDKDQLLWAVSFMQSHYRKKAIQKDWESCFRIHNTGRATGTPSRKDYVIRGLARMKYYQKWIDNNGNIF